jgi:hypothetical protein
MQVSDIIQISILAILTLTLIAIYRQFILQNKIFKAQLLKDRYEMYSKTYDVVTDDHVINFNDFPNDWIDNDLYERKYKNNEKKIRRYLNISKTYEYLAFTWKIKSLKIPDMLGDNWIKMWVEQLIDNDEFLDVYDSYKGYYPDFENFISNILTHDKRLNRTINHTEQI